MQKPGVVRKMPRSSVNIAQKLLILYLENWGLHLRFRIIPKQNAFFPKNKMRLDATGRN